VKDDQVVLGTRLRRLRLAKGLTQREVAAPAYTHAYISTIEAGRRQPSPEALRHFAERLGVDVDDLVSGRPPGLVTELEAALRDARTAASEGRLDEVEATVGSVERRAHRYGVRRIQARAHEIRALVLERSGRLEDALEEFERSEHLLRDEPPVARVEAIAGKARCLQALGDIRYAIFVLESLRRSAAPDEADLGFRVHVAAGLLNAYLDAGLLTAAEEAAEELERSRPRLRDHVRRGQLYLYLARLRATQGKAREADRLLADAADAYEASGLRTETGYAHLARGILLSREHKLNAAEKELARARGIFEETRNEKELCNTLVELARVERLRDRTDEAAAMLESVIRRLDGGHTELLAWAHREYALLFVERDPAVSEKHLRQALDLFDRGDEHVETAATYRMLGDLLRANGDRGAAFEAYAAGIHRLPASS
jgi:transcriptional regulator with XRE-family HTH domain